MSESLLPRWPVGLWLLECVDIERETHDVKTFHFRISPGKDGVQPLCLHRPGQFVTLRFRHEGQLIARSYTISSSPSRPRLLSITIKRDPNGLVSRFMHDRFKVGELLPVNGPGGTFDLVSVEPREKLLMLSGGSGITPLISMLRYIKDLRETNFSISFVHAARTATDILFRDELELIAARFGVKLLFICEREAETRMVEGYLTKDVLSDFAPEILDSTVLTCGPSAFMDAVKSMLSEMNFDMTHYHEESFGDPQERKNPDGASVDKLSIDLLEVDPVSETKVVDTVQAAEQAEFEIESKNEVTFTTSDKTVSYKAGQSLLDIAASVGIAIPTNCQMGLCGTCMAICSEGHVAMDDDEGLTESERESGFVLTCCGRPNGKVSIKL